MMIWCFPSSLGGHFKSDEVFGRWRACFQPNGFELAAQILQGLPNLHWIGRYAAPNGP